MTIEVRRAGVGDIETLRELARAIWFEHYPSIISRSQIHYMLERGYAADVVAAEIARGVEWRLASVDGRACGFAAWEAFGDRVKLHKLYVQRSVRVGGVGRALVAATAADAGERGARLVYLAVNKRNRIAIRAYVRMGFAFHRAMRIDIGHGFVMDDYEMARPVQASIRRAFSVRPVG